MARTPVAEPAPDLVPAAIKIFDPDFDTLNLFQKIARITGMIGGVEKKGYNAFHKYHYVTEGDLVSAVRQYLAAAGIVIIPNVMVLPREGELTIVDTEYTVTDGNESFTFHMPGYGADRGDKGVYKAITGSQKYALMKLFKIETGDDPEGDTRTDERAAQTNARPAPTVTTGVRGNVTRGAHSSKASPVQIRRISELTRELDLSRKDTVDVINTVLNLEIVLPEEEAKQSETIVEALKEIEPDDAVKLIDDLTHRLIMLEPSGANGYP